MKARALKLMRNNVNILILRRCNREIDDGSLCARFERGTVSAESGMRLARIPQTAMVGQIVSVLVEPHGRNEDTTNSHGRTDQLCC